MEKLDQKYQMELDTLRGVIQSSDLLATYLDDEEETSYQAIRAEFEPLIEAFVRRRGVFAAAFVGAVGDEFAGGREQTARAGR